MGIDVASAPHLPDFQTFLSWKRTVLARQAEPEADFLDLSETRIARALAPLVPSVPATFSGAPPHRCDLARLWLARRGLPADMSRRALVGRGVRDVLSRYFALTVREGVRVAIPSDVYPAYVELARDAGVTSDRGFKFPTFPDFDYGSGLSLENTLRTCSQLGAQHVLLPYPLKLHGRSWTTEEVSAAVAWLQERPGDFRQGRRLVLDGVYSFGEPACGNLKRLLSTGQVTYLDSLSKSWLHEQVFGVALVPESDRVLVGTVIDPEPDPQNLHLAQVLLRDHPGTPERVRVEVTVRNLGVGQVLLANGFQVLLSRPRGYLLAVNQDYRELARHGFLVLPASVFGSREPDWSLLSAL